MEPGPGTGERNPFEKLDSVVGGVNRRSLQPGLILPPGLFAILKYDLNALNVLSRSQSRVKRG